MPPTEPVEVDVRVAVVGAVEDGVSYRKLTVVGSPTVPPVSVNVPVIRTISLMSYVEPMMASYASCNATPTAACTTVMPSTS